MANTSAEIQDIVKAKIKTEASHLGFSLCGFTTPAPPEKFEIFERWLEQGHHAQMSYLSSTKNMETRKNPLLLMPEAQSVICIAFPYPIRNQGALEEKRIAMIAGYAMDEDYHLVLPRLLRQLVSRVESIINKPLQFKIFTDSAPINERGMAKRAGLGWIGKNSCLISPKIGSVFLLAELFTDLEISPDKPFTEDRCGSCDRCIRSCPCSCILSDRTINSNDCISYQTIENRGSIPQELFLKIGNWLFGCDVCQMVCPWNRKIANLQNLIPSLDLETSDLIALLKLDPNSFSNRFRNTALARAKWKGLVRNALIVLGNSRMVETIPAINGFIRTNQESELMEPALWAVHQARLSREEN
jgi:epoxyqueuosine reductase